MKTTKLSQEDIRKLVGDEVNLGALIKAFENEFLNNGEIICQFKLNGMVLSENDELRLKEVSLNQVETIEIESEMPIDLLFGLLKNWITELPILLKNIDLLSKEIKYEGIEDHLKAFVDLIDSCQYLMESLQHLKGIINLKEENLKQWSVNEKLTERAIKDAFTAFETKDFVQLSEILEYDLGNTLQCWLEELQKIQIELMEESKQDGRQFEERIFNKKGAEA